VNLPGICPQCLKEDKSYFHGRPPVQVRQARAPGHPLAAPGNLGAAWQAG